MYVCVCVCACVYEYTNMKKQGIQRMILFIEFKYLTMLNVLVLH